MRARDAVAGIRSTLAAAGIDRERYSCRVELDELLDVIESEVGDADPDRVQDIAPERLNELRRAASSGADAPTLTLPKRLLLDVLDLVAHLQTARVALRRELSQALHQLADRQAPPVVVKDFVALYQAARVVCDDAPFELDRREGLSLQVDRLAELYAMCRFELAGRPQHSSPNIAPQFTVDPNDPAPVWEQLARRAPTPAADALLAELDASARFRDVAERAFLGSLRPLFRDDAPRRLASLPVVEVVCQLLDEAVRTGIVTHYTIRLQGADVVAHVARVPLGADAAATVKRLRSAAGLQAAVEIKLDPAHTVRVLHPGGGVTTECDHTFRGSPECLHCGEPFAMLLARHGLEQLPDGTVRVRPLTPEGRAVLAGLATDPPPTPAQLAALDALHRWLHSPGGDCELTEAAQPFHDEREAQDGGAECAQLDREETQAYAELRASIGLGPEVPPEGTPPPPPGQGEVVGVPLGAQLRERVAALVEAGRIGPTVAHAVQMLFVMGLLDSEGQDPAAHFGEPVPHVSVDGMFIRFALPHTGPARLENLRSLYACLRDWFGEGDRVDPLQASADAALAALPR